MNLLEPKDYNKISSILSTTSFNTLFAQSVVCRNVKGSIYVDNIEQPQSAYISHPYGMSLLVGSTGQSDFNGMLFQKLLNLDGKRQTEEYLQVFPCEWDALLHLKLSSFLEQLPNGSSNSQIISNSSQSKIQRYQRLNFRFDQKLFDSNRPMIKSETIQPLDRTLFETIDGKVVPKHFWNSGKEFLQKSVGFCLIVNHEIVSTAFASFLIGNQLEIGVETKSGYRGKGFAAIVCSALIDYCIKNGYIPVWSCHAGNSGSKHLALRLGFQITASHSYYRLVS